MSNLDTAGWLLAGSLVLLLASNGYWWWRARVTERSRQTAQAVEEEFSYVEGQNTANEVLLGEAAVRANVPPDRLPDRIERLNDRIRDLETALESHREMYARTIWDAITTESPDVFEQNLVSLELSGGSVKDARAVSKQALESDVMIAVILSGDGSFAVGVGSVAVESVTAASIADDIAEACGGGAGGGEQLATGGGSDVSAARDAIDTVTGRIRERLADQHS